MSFIIVGLALLVWVFLFVLWGIKHFRPKPVQYFHNAAFDMKLLHGGYIPSLPGDSPDLIRAKLSPGGQYKKLPNGDFLRVGDLPPWAK